MSTVREAIAKRSSTRGYTTEALTQEELDAILTAGLQAPTGMNLQELFFTVVRGDAPILAEVEAEKLRQREMGEQPHNSWYEAPTVILISAEEEQRWSKVDTGIAVENMALAAEELGLGSLIIGSIYDALRGEKAMYFAEKLQIPEGKVFQIALAVGHKATEKTPHTYDREKQVKLLD